MPLFVTERSFSCFFTSDAFQLHITFVLTARFVNICGLSVSMFLFIYFNICCISSTVVLVLH